MGVDADHHIALRRAIQAPSPPRAAPREAEMVVVADPVGARPSASWTWTVREHPSEPDPGPT